MDVPGLAAVDVKPQARESTMVDIMPMGTTQYVLLPQDPRRPLADALAADAPRDPRRRHSPGEVACRTESSHVLECPSSHTASQSVGPTGAMDAQGAHQPSMNTIAAAAASEGQLAAMDGGSPQLLDVMPPAPTAQAFRALEAPWASSRPSMVVAAAAPMPSPLASPGWLMESCQPIDVAQWPQWQSLASGAQAVVPQCGLHVLGSGMPACGAVPVGAWHQPCPAVWGVPSPLWTAGSHCVEQEACSLSVQPPPQERSLSNGEEQPRCCEPQTGSQDEEAKRRLSAYNALLLGDESPAAGEAEDEEAPWRRQKRRRLRGAGRGAC